MVRRVEGEAERDWRWAIRIRWRQVRPGDRGELHSEGRWTREACTHTHIRAQPGQRVKDKRCTEAERSEAGGRRQTDANYVA